MQTSPIERKLAAILAADVVGYSRLMSDDEEATLNILHACLEIFKSCIPEHDGRVFGGAGDSVIAEFHSSVKAVCCAIKIQELLAKRNATVSAGEHMQFRIGINVGDVVVEGNGLMGDGVNVAARLEGLADPGGICISVDVYHQVRNKLDLRFENLGKQKLKNIPEPLEVYRAMIDASGVGTAQRRCKKSKVHYWLTVMGGISILVFAVSALLLMLPETGVPPAAQIQKGNQSEKPSIVVLPFINMGGDTKQEYFVDGITEDIITDLSRLSNLIVLAINTSYRYKGEAVQPRQVGKELGVHFVLNGSVRKSGDRLRITAQLVNVENGSNIWADRYDRKLVEVFKLQDEVTQKIVSALAINLTVDEKKNLTHTATNNLEAYEFFLIGQKHFRQRTKEGNDLAQQAYRSAIELDPSYARAYGALAIVNIQDYRRGWAESPEIVWQSALELALKAVSMDEASPQTNWALGFVYLFRQEYEKAIASAEKAVALAPNYADGYALLGFINNWQGHADQSLSYIRKSMALNPHYTFEYPWNLGLAYYTLGRYSEAVESLQKALERNENAMYPRLYLAATYARLEQFDDAEWEIAQLQLIFPEMTLTHLAKTLPYEDKANLKVVLEDLRKAGFPE